MFDQREMTREKLFFSARVNRTTVYTETVSEWIDRWIRVKLIIDGKL